jgi:hypothetical protein
MGSKLAADYEITLRELFFRPPGTREVLDLSWEGKDDLIRTIPPLSLSGHIIL